MKLRDIFPPPRVFAPEETTIMVDALIMLLTEKGIITLDEVRRQYKTEVEFRKSNEGK